MKVLCLAAHADDEVLGCGGTLARLVMEGHEVGVALLQLRHLRQQSDEAAKILGFYPFYSDIGMYDNRFDARDLLEIVQIVEDIIFHLQPDVVYTHHTNDLNIDHRITAQAVLTATRPLEGGVVKEVLMFEVPSSTDWSFSYAFKPNVFMDISETLEKKQQAMACYDTETRRFPHPRSPEALQALATRWGSVAGRQAAEAFELVRSIR